MDGIRNISRAYYERANEDEKKSAKEFFTRLDANGNGKVSLQEFKKSATSSFSDTKIFKQLDANGDGALDFYDVLALYYMEKKIGMHKCNACRVLLVDPYFSCLLCIENGDDSFDLCCSCYREEKLEHHQHSLSNFLDNNALFVQFKFKVADAQKVQKKFREREMKEIRKVAKAYYKGATAAEKKLAGKLFRSLDTDGDGKVSLREYKKLVHPFFSNGGFFKKLDGNGDGTLDFYEVLALYYMEKVSVPRCNACRRLLMDSYFSCLPCQTNVSYYLCCKCYGGGKFEHHHPSNKFMDSRAMLRLLDQLLKEAQITSQQPENDHMGLEGVEKLVDGEVENHEEEDEDEDGEVEEEEDEEEEVEEEEEDDDEDEEVIEEEVGEVENDDEDEKEEEAAAAAADEEIESDPKLDANREEKTKKNGRAGRRQSHHRSRTQRMKETLEAVNIGYNFGNSMVNLGNAAVTAGCCIM